MNHGQYRYSNITNENKRSSIKYYIHVCLFFSYLYCDDIMIVLFVIARKLVSCNCSLTCCLSLCIGCFFNLERGHESEYRTHNDFNVLPDYKFSQATHEKLLHINRSRVIDSTFFVGYHGLHDTPIKCKHSQSEFIQQVFHGASHTCEGAAFYPMHYSGANWAKFKQDKVPEIQQVIGNTCAKKCVLYSKLSMCNTLSKN
jgi:hypothetical protein